MPNQQLSNKSYRNKAVSQFFDKHGEEANIQGVVPSERFRKDPNGEAEHIGRTEEVGTDGGGNKVYKKIHDDIQFQGTSLEFQDINYVTFSDKPVFDGIKSWAIRFKAPNTGFGALLFSKHLDTGNQREIHVAIVSTGEIKVLLSADGNNTTTKEYQTFSQWDDDLVHRLVVTFDANVLKIFIDETEDTPYTKISDDTVNSIHNGTADFIIGEDARLTGSTFEGVLSDMSLYNVVLSSQEIAEIDLNNPKLPGLVFLAPLESSNTDRVYDVIGGTSGTIINYSTDQWINDNNLGYSHLNSKGYTGYFKTTPSTGKVFTLGNVGNDKNTLVVEFIPIDTGNHNNPLILGVDSTSTPVVIQYETGGDLRCTFNGGNNWHVISSAFDFGDYISLALNYDSDADEIKYSIDGGATQTIAYTNTPTSATLNKVVVGGVAQENSDRETIIKRHEIYSEVLSDSNLEALSVRGIRELDSQGIGASFSTAASFIYSGSDTNFYVPASLTTPSEDIYETPLEYKGKLAPRAQMVNAPCVTFDGVDQYVEIADDSIFDFTTVMSAFIWLKASTDDATTRNVFSKYTTTGNQRSWSIILKDGELRVIIDKDGDSTTRKDYITTSENISDGEWHCIGFTFEYNNPGDDLKLYVDGVYITDVTKSFDGIVSSIFNSTSVVSIGARGDVAGFVEGEVFLPCIWDGVLTPSEVSNLMVFVIPDDYVLFMPFSEGDGKVVHDISGNENHGSLINSPVLEVWANTQSIFHWSFMKNHWKFTELAHRGGDIIRFPNTDRYPEDKTYLDDYITGSEKGWFLSVHSRRVDSYGNGIAFIVRDTVSGSTHSVSFEDDGSIDFEDPALVAFGLGNELEYYRVYNQFPSANRTFTYIEYSGAGKGPTARASSGSWKVLQNVSNPNRTLARMDFNGSDEHMKASVSFSLGESYQGCVGNGNDVRDPEYRALGLEAGSAYQYIMMGYLIGLNTRDGVGDYASAYETDTNQNYVNTATVIGVQEKSGARVADFNLDNRQQKNSNVNDYSSTTVQQIILGVDKNESVFCKCDIGEYWGWETERTEQERRDIEFIVNKTYEIATYEKAVGYENNGKQWNGASDIQFTDIPENPINLRGESFSFNEIGGVSNIEFQKRNNSISKLIVLNDGMTDLEIQRNYRERLPSMLDSSTQLAYSTSQLGTYAYAGWIYKEATNPLHVGFVNGKIDEATILNFKGSATTLYFKPDDQSDNDRHIEILSGSSWDELYKIYENGDFIRNSDSQVCFKSGGEWHDIESDVNWLKGVGDVSVFTRWESGGNINAFGIHVEEVSGSKYNWLVPSTSSAFPNEALLMIAFRNGEGDLLGWSNEVYNYTLNQTLVTSLMLNSNTNTLVFDGGSPDPDLEDDVSGGINQDMRPSTQLGTAPVDITGRLRVSGTAHTYIMQLGYKLTDEPTWRAWLNQL